MVKNHENHGVVECFGHGHATYLHLPENQQNTAAAFFQRPGPDLPKCYDPIGVTRTVLSAPASQKTVSKWRSHGLRTFFF